MKRISAIFITLLHMVIFAQVPPYITPGTTFVDGQRLTAAELAALVSNASINYTFYSTATGETILGNGDQILVLTSGNQYRRISAANFILNNTNWYSSMPIETNVSTNGFVAVWDGGATGQLFKVNATNWLAVYSILGSPTNWLSNLMFGTYDTTTGRSWAFNWQYLGTNWNQWFSYTNNPSTSTNGITTFTNITDSDLVAWYNSKAQSNGVQIWKTIKQSITNTSVIGDARNLTIYTDGAFGSNAAWMSADEIVLKNLTTNGVPGSVYVAKGFSNYLLLDNVFYPNPTWGGRDTNVPVFIGGYFAYVWAISDGTNQGAIISTNPVIPVLPANVQYGALVGCIPMDGNGNLRSTMQLGRNVYTIPTMLVSANFPTNYSAMWATNQFQTNSGNATNLAAVFDTFIPPIAKTVSGIAGSTDTSADAALCLCSATSYTPSSTTNYVGELTIRGTHTTTAFNGFTFSEPFTLPLDNVHNPGGPIIFWRSLDAARTNGVLINGFSL